MVLFSERGRLHEVHFRAGDGLQAKMILWRTLLWEHMFTKYAGNIWETADSQETGCMEDRTQDSGTGGVAEAL